MSSGIVVVGLDGSDQSLMALERAVEEARLRNARLHVAYCSDVTGAILHLPGDVTINTRDLAEAHRDEIWARAAPLLESSGVEVTLVELEGYPADELVDYCDEHDASLLVLGTRGRGRLASTFLGSTSLRALEHAHCDVLVAKSGGEKPT